MKKKPVIEELLSFAKNLELLRLEQGLTFRQLSDRVGIPPTSLWEYERAVTDPPLTAIQKIAKYFDEDIDWLSGDNPTRRLKKIAE